MGFMGGALFDSNIDQVISVIVTLYLWTLYRLI